ncbi:maleylpyruvate isomerase family mycothiol-dependent enzyme [Blastococcus sp. VKM Ac-2987]|uniref:maleylpyruvate isomerase family mycothiol-dependent enzyme n=1 Tax=Blastococcus sp. VKM Ac-2987 TaxID=3004141 RepID=UPI0022ABB7C1|nr:maleylpyruvate isomerase family mycothiol-dependent enzyme [Blastococcus sp. VKM Ac-2987]MCZ2858684.1 maleylpyruvate isomerase family mycothiol-dependent enzyme [Blastococcus sp. VKM Ac-2987]
MPASRRPRVALLAHVAAERHDLCDYLETLDDRDWQVRSLCPAWTVHDLLAHLTLSHRQTLRATLAHVVLARGDLDRAEAEWAHELSAEHSPAELIALLRETAAVDHRVPLSGPLDPLTDVLVHGQDIARPLGHRREMRPDRALPALRHVWSNGFYGRPGKRFAGLRMVATDADWSAGTDGPEVRGAVGDLLLLATGRAAGLDGLSGPGVGAAAGVLQLTDA